VTLYLTPRACSVSRYNQTCLQRAVSLGEEPGTPGYAEDAITDRSGCCVETAPAQESRLPLLLDRITHFCPPNSYLEVGKEDSSVQAGRRKVASLPAQHLTCCHMPH